MTSAQVTLTMSQGGVRIVIEWGIVHELAEGTTVKLNTSYCVEHQGELVRLNGLQAREMGVVLNTIVLCLVPQW